MTQNQLKILFSEILRGVSKAHAVVKSSHGPIYFRHPSLFSTSAIEDSYDEYLTEAKKSGLKTRAETEESIILDGEWSHEQNKEIENLRSYRQSLLKSQSLLVKRSEKEEFNVLIKETDDKLNPILAEKESLIGFTAEVYANRRVNERLVLVSFYKDEKCTVPLLEQDEIDDFTDEDLGELLKTYSELAQKFEDKNLKRLALNHFFLNLFLLCDNDPYKFYGKCVVELTFYQLNVFAHGKRFKSLLESRSEDIPEKLFDDPDAFVEWFETRRNAQALVGEGNDIGSIVGATKEDLEALGVDMRTMPDMHKKAAEKGGTLSMQDLLAMGID